MKQDTDPDKNQDAGDDVRTPGANPREAARFQTQDGVQLQGKLFGNPDLATMAVVVHPATGVLSGYYAAFANWLAVNHNAVVLTYDYRDFGGSARRPVREATANMSDWGIRDQEAALAYILECFGHLPVRIVGHSLGAQWLAFHKDIGRVDRVVAVASGPNYWLDQPLSYLPAVVWFWWLAGPLTTKVIGYLPGWLGFGADLPKDVYWQWRRWCLSREFSRPEWGMSLPSPKLNEARFHLTLLPVADDVMIPPLMVRRLPTFYPHARVQEDLIVPKDFGLKEIGHLRVFAPRSKAVWPRIAAALRP
jgi:predicted alpha/beta hydrolase